MAVEAILGQNWLDALVVADRLVGNSRQKRASTTAESEHEATC